MPPRLQTLVLESVLDPADRLKQVAAEATRLIGKWDGSAAARLLAPGADTSATRLGFAHVAMNQGPCAMGKPMKSDGTSSATFRLTCQRGTADLAVKLDPATGRVAEMSVSTVDGSSRCPL